jgi:hypothetical protein
MMVGAMTASSTVITKDCVAVPAAFVAVRVMKYQPSFVVEACPEKVAVPSPLSVKVIPGGRVPDSVKLGAGLPVVVTVKSIGTRASMWSMAAEVMVGGVFTVTFTVLDGGPEFPESVLIST